MNKRGQLSTILTIIIGLVFVVLICMGAAIGWGVLKISSDEIIPAFEDIGEIAPGINVSEYATMALTPVDIIIDNMPLLIGLLYLVGIAGMLSLAYISRTNRNLWMIGLFVLLVILVIAISIFLSQYYEDFYLGQDELGANLRDAALISYLVIYSPTILTIVAFIAAIILFTGEEEQFR